MKLKVLYTIILLTFITQKSFSNTYSNDSIPVIKKEKQNKIKFGFSNYIVSKYIPKSGTQLGKGIANQSLAYVSYSNFTAYVWANYNFSDKKINEVDYGLVYKYKLSKDFLKGSLFSKTGIHGYSFPTPDMHNLIIEETLTYKGNVGIDVLYSYCAKSTKIDDGSRIYVEFYKPFSLKSKKFKSKITPYISSAYHWGFYGWKGFAHITPGIKYKSTFSKFSLNAFVNYQFSSNDISYEHLTDEKFLYGGIGIEL